MAKGRRRRGGEIGHVVSCARGRRRDRALSNGTAMARHTSMMTNTIFGHTHTIIPHGFESTQVFENLNFYDFLWSCALITLGISSYGIY